MVPRSGADGGDLRIAEIKIIENSPAAVALDASFINATGNRATVRFRLTTGQVILEVRPGDGVASMQLRSTPRYVVVPDYFGNDMVFTAVTGNGNRVGLPAENFFLTLDGTGDALTMCVWESNRQDADMLVSGTSGRREIRGCEVTCDKGKRIWLALLTKGGIWHGRQVAPGPRMGNRGTWRSIGNRLSPPSGEAVSEAPTA